MFFVPETEKFNPSSPELPLPSARHAASYPSMQIMSGV